MSLLNNREFISVIHSFNKYLLITYLQCFSTFFFISYGDFLDIYFFCLPPYEMEHHRYIIYLFMYCGLRLFFTKLYLLEGNITLTKNACSTLSHCISHWHINSEQNRQSLWCCSEGEIIKYKLCIVTNARVEFWTHVTGQGGKKSLL